MEENYSIQVRYSNALSTDHQVSDCVCLSHLNKPAMAYEALDSLQQTLTQILKRHDDLATRRVKRDVISIHDKTVVLQLNLKAFPEKETIREVASATHEIIEYLFSPENLSDCGSIEPTVRVSNQLTELAEVLDSIVGDVADYCKNNVRQLSEYPPVSSSSRSAHMSKDVVGIGEDPTVSVEPTVRLSYRLGRLAEKILSSPKDLEDYSMSNDDSVNTVRQLSDYPPDSSSISSKIAQLDAMFDIDEGRTFSIDLTTTRLLHWLERFEKLTGNILLTRRNLADYVRRLNDALRSAATNSDAVIGIDGDLSYSPADAVSSLSRPAPTSKDGVVGLEKDFMQIMDWLTRGSLKLEVLPIVGMGGIGKSTLAKIVYDHPWTRHQFDIRAWITISQDYSVGITCLNLLASIKGKGKEIQAGSDLYKVEEIYNHLWGKTYLIVMDDMWSIKAWDDIRMLFPDNGCGSRIILTTRLRDMAASIAGFSSHIHMVRFLDDQQSWHLFERKAFADQICPLELQSVAKKIVRSCGGLPLSVVTVAEHLSRIGTTPKFWEQIVATDGDGQLESILSLSYNHLPHHLKACFLYMAGFPEDYEIRVSELIKLWVAEGFIIEHQYGSKFLEETAEEYLTDFVERSLVLVTSWKTDGKIKSCRLHNNVRDFCVRQAGQKKFLLPVMDYLPTPILRRHFLPQLLKNHRRVSASWYDLDLRDSMHSSCTHSIICNPQKGYRPKGSVRNFSSLRVLHVLRRDDHSHWELGQVFDLIHLTYLASYIPSSIVPPAISKLQNLQTLTIYRSEVHLPVEIWRMRQLRHLIAFSFDPLPHPEAAALPLENLRTLSLTTNLVCSGRMVEMIQNIQKLGICYSGEKIDEGYHLDNLTHLLQLEKLKLEMRSNAFWPSLNRPVFPVSLKKLTLSGCRLPCRDMTIIGLLPNLHVLRLRNYVFDRERWETTDGEFSSLRLLLIDESNLQYWTIETRPFPRLKCLMLHRCPYLYDIPSDFAWIPTLELIEVDDLNQSLLHSAKMIQEEQRSWGIDELQVRLKSF